MGVGTQRVPTPHLMTIIMMMMMVMTMMLVMVMMMVMTMMVVIVIEKTMMIKITKVILIFVTMKKLSKIQGQSNEKNLQEKQPK